MTPGTLVRVTGYGYSRKARFRVEGTVTDRKYGDCVRLLGPLDGTPGADRRRYRVVPAAAVTKVRM